MVLKDLVKREDVYLEKKNTYVEESKTKIYCLEDELKFELEGMFSRAKIINHEDCQKMFIFVWTYKAK